MTSICLQKERRKGILSRFTAAVVLAAAASLGSQLSAEPLQFATIGLVPYALEDPSAEKPGMIVEINAAIAERAQVEIVDTTVPITRLVKNLQRGVSDCAILARSAKNEQTFEPVALVMEDLDRVIVTHPGLTLTKLEDLYGLTLAIPRGSFRNRRISSDPEINRLLTNGHGQSVQLLKADRVDAIAGSALSIFYYFKDQGISRSDVGTIFPFFSASMWLHCTSGKVDPETLAKLRQAIDELRSEGVFEEITRAYVPDEFN
ncbi:MAG: transporter substrate-binding domain-containing protein [Thalassovita sp.]